MLDRSGTIKSRHPRMPTSKAHPTIQPTVCVCLIISRTFLIAVVESLKAQNRDYYRNAKPDKTGQQREIEKNNYPVSSYPARNGSNNNDKKTESSGNIR